MNTFQAAIVTSAIRARVAELMANDPDTDADALLAVIEAEVPDAAAVLLGLVRAVDEAETAMEGVASRMQSLAERQRRYRAKAETYRGLLFSIMDTMGQKKWKHPEATVSITDGRPGVVVTDEAALPEAFVRIKREPDKAAIKAALERGELVNGAGLSNGLASLSIRMK